MDNWDAICDAYRGQWIALSDDEQTVVAADTSIKKARELSAEKGNDNPIMFRVPEKIADFVGYENSL